MFLKSFSILLIAAVLFKPMMGLYMVVDYEINKDYFAKYLCENQDRPELQCQGKCFLMQKIKKQHHENESHRTKQLSQISKIEIMDISRSMKIKFSKELSLFTTPLLSIFHKADFFSSVFRPPILG